MTRAATSSAPIPNVALLAPLTLSLLLVPPAQAQEAAPAGSAPPIAAVPAPAPACVPDCRSGYFCSNGQCLSKCNPPCAAHETCTDAAQCVASAPAAAPPAPPAPPPPPPAASPEPSPTSVALPASAVEERPRGVRTHDGFYFRLALGVGALSGSNTFYENEAVDGSDELDVDSSGTAILTELALGGSPTPGLAVGIGSYGASIGTTSLTVDGEDIGESSSVVSMLGPFVDLYPNPEIGFHLQLAAGMAAVTVAEDGPVDDEFAGVGFGLMAGIGYEGWVGEQWSLGGLARLLYASATLGDAAGNDEIDVEAVVPGVLFAVTYH